ncbi:chemotaxis protein CheW [Solirubrobacter soli]|uniref:chemotaxis protein CheW n=1 Tax=Solirubrobacter soli TaxID=363832 RepID=UPI00056996DE|nr:chemotaxis protein CheW [Solirubrobacter soli]
MQIVVFSYAAEEYALPITDVQEIIRYVRPRPVSDSGYGIEGVISLRGKIIPVCDLGARMGLAAESEGHSIVIVETGAGAAGVMVDQVDQVRTVTEDQIEPNPVSDDGLIQSIVKIGEDRLIVLLDAQLLLSGVVSA